MAAELINFLHICKFAHLCDRDASQTTARHLFYGQAGHSSPHPPHWSMPGVDEMKTKRGLQQSMNLHILLDYFLARVEFS